MVAISAAEVTAQIIFRELLAGQQGARNPMVMVGTRITVAAGTSLTYPTGGIPLTNLFSSAGGVSDTKIDPSQPVFTMGPGIMRVTATDVTFGLPCFHYDGGNTAALQLLVVQNVLADGGTNPTAFAEFGASDFSVAGTSGGLGNTIVPVVNLIFVGRIREGEIL